MKRSSTYGNKTVFDFTRPFAGGPMECGFDYFFGLHKTPNSAPYFYIKGRNPKRKEEGK